MAQKIFSGRATDPALPAAMAEVKVDQIVISRSPESILVGDLGRLGGITPRIEVIVYESSCIRSWETHPSPCTHARKLASALPTHDVTYARSGAGYSNVVHLERFSGPGRLCITDDPRLAGSGGAGMLVWLVSSDLLSQALVTGAVTLRVPRSVQVILTGRCRPFVAARDVTLELSRRGVPNLVRALEEKHGAPVALEFGGPSAHLLSVGDRAILCSSAPLLGAVCALFVSDEATEAFLRDQRRSKAFRALAPDAGAPCDDVVHLDLSGVDPLVRDETGVVRAVRELAGRSVSQLLLGGDSGMTLRDFLNVAIVLRSKRIPSHMDLLLAPPSRQVLDALSSSGALTDFFATGARLIEPDGRVMDGLLYPPPADGSGLRTCDPMLVGASRGSFLVASSDTLAYAVATGELGDPRGFKRPVRVAVPRSLSTDDVLLARPRRCDSVTHKK